MTLNSAIEHAERVAANCDGECSENHWQLAEWLRELQALRAAVFGFERMYNQLKAENEKLKKRLVQYELFREVVGDPAHEFAIKVPHD